MKTLSCEAPVEVEDYPGAKLLFNIEYDLELKNAEVITTNNVDDWSDVDIVELVVSPTKLTFLLPKVKGGGSMTVDRRDLVLRGAGEGFKLGKCKIVRGKKNKI